MTENTKIEDLNKSLLNDLNSGVALSDKHYTKEIVEKSSAAISELRKNGISWQDIADLINKKKVVLSGRFVEINGKDLSSEMLNQKRKAKRANIKLLELTRS